MFGYVVSYCANNFDGVLSGINKKNMNKVKLIILLLFYVQVNHGQNGNQKISKHIDDIDEIEELFIDGNFETSSETITRGSNIKADKYTEGFNLSVLSPNANVDKALSDYRKRKIKEEIVEYSIIGVVILLLVFGAFKLKNIYNLED